MLGSSVEAVLLGLEEGPSGGLGVAIRGEVVVPVTLALAALPGQRIEDIERAFDTLRTLREPSAPPLRFDDDLDDAFLDRVAALLSPTPAPRDEIARALNAPVAQVAAALLELSLTGRAELLPGGLASL